MSLYATPELCDYFERQCDRFVNGGCSTLRCVRRGQAQRPGVAPLLKAGQLSTCEAFEAAHIIADIIGRDYGPYYEMTPENMAQAKAEIHAEAVALGHLLVECP